LLRFIFYSSYQGPERAHEATGASVVFFVDDGDDGFREHRGEGWRGARAEIDGLLLFASEFSSFASTHFSLEVATAAAVKWGPAPASSGFRVEGLLWSRGGDLDLGGLRRHGRRRWCNKGNHGFELLMAFASLSAKIVGNLC
jgi:hypothetical protein